MSKPIANIDGLLLEGTCVNTGNYNTKMKFAWRRKTLQAGVSALGLSTWEPEVRLAKCVAERQHSA